MDPREGDELNKYLMDDSQAGFKKRHLWDDPYLFWNSDYARGKYKTLRMVAQIIFSVPAGAVGCERLFSALKRVVNSRSTRLTPRNTNDKLIAGAWLRLGVFDFK